MGIPRHIYDRVVAFFRKNYAACGPTGLAIRVKRIGNALKLWLRARQTGTPIVRIEDWVKKTVTGFPKLLDGLQRFPAVVLERLTKLHKLVKPNEFQGKDNVACKAIRSEIEARVADVLRPSVISTSSFKEACRLIQLGSAPIHVDANRIRTVWKPHKPDQSVDHVLNVIEAFGRWGHKDTPLGECLGTEFAPFPINNILAHKSWADSKNTDPFPDTGLVGGSYEITHEAGCKARCYFNVEPTLNSMLEPLYRGLEHFERRSGHSVRYNDIHDRIKPVQKWLQDGRTVWSIDQTSATDRFPLALQKYFLHCCGVEPLWIRLVDKVCHLPFTIQDELRPIVQAELGLSEPPTTLTIGCGQPMGATFSMPLYTSAFIALLRGACIAWGWNPEFCVLGDDLVAADPGLARWVEEFLPTIGVTISTSKGVVSDSLAEFVGATITPQDYVFPGTWPFPTKENWYEISKGFNEPFDLPGMKDQDRLKRAYGFGRLSELAFHRAKDADIDPNSFSLEEMDKVCLYWSHTPPKSPVSLNQDGALDKLSEEFGIQFDELHDRYNSYRRARLIKTLTGFSKKLVSGEITSMGTWLDNQFSRRFWDQDEILNWIPDYERESYLRITAVTTKIYTIVGEDLSRLAGKACKSFCKADVRGRDQALGQTLGLLAEFLNELVTKLVPVKKKYPVHAMDLLFADLEGVIAELHELLTAKKPEGYKADKERFNSLVSHFLSV